MTRCASLLCTTLLGICMITSAGFAGPQSNESQPGKTQAAQSDSAFQRYAYPRATPRGTQGSAQAVSKTFTTPDSFDKVVRFYIKKFAKPGMLQDDTARFVQNNPDGSSFVVTVINGYDKRTKIILREQKKPA